jgi:hypothetical protein
MTNQPAAEPDIREIRTLGGPAGKSERLAMISGVLARPVRGPTQNTTA